MSRKRLRVSTFLLLGTALAMIFAACGDDEEPTATPTQPANTPTEEPDPTATPEPTNTPDTGGPTATPGGDDPTATPAPTNTPVPTATPIVTLGGGDDLPEPDNPVGTLTMAITGPLNPAPGLGSAQAPVESIQDWGVGGGLFNLDDNFNVVPKLATGFELEDDLSAVTITLREDVEFHNGDPFGADDVVFTLNDANADFNPTSIHGQAGDFAALFGEAEVVDEYTVHLPFKSYDLRWNGNFLNEGAQGTSYFSKELYDRVGADEMTNSLPVSTGPMEITEWVANDHATIQAVDYDHWDMNPEIDQITFQEVAEAATRVALLETGEADISANLPLQNLSSLGERGFNIESITGRGTIHNIIFSGNYWATEHARTGEPVERQGYCSNDLPWVGWVECGPNDEEDFEEARNVRQALSVAIDRQLLVDSILEGFGDPASMEYVDTTAPYYQDRWDIPYDPDQAEQLMSETAWPDGGFEIGIWTGGELGGGRGTNGQINDAIAGFWQELWPDMQLQVFKSAYTIIRPGLVGRTNSIPYGGDCDEGATTIPFDWPHGLTETTLTRGGFGCGIEIPRIAETYLEVAQTTDPQRRIELNEDLIDYLHEERVIAGTVQVPDVIAYNPNAIAEWDGRPDIFANANEFEHIVPAER